MLFFRSDRQNVFLACAIAFILGCVVIIAGQKLVGFFLDCRDQFDQLNPKVMCRTSATQSEWDYEPLRDVLVRKKEEWKSAGKLAHLSVYFRDLDNGPRFGIGEYDDFHPASLLKVPVMMAVLHDADREPSLLDQKLAFTGPFGNETSVEQPAQTILPDTPYTVRELLQKMIMYSDNHSKELLMEKLNATPPPVVYRTYLDLDLLGMMKDPEADYVSIQTYANLFAVLYNAGYLSRKMSQFALELLTHTTYHDGLVAGVPSDVRIAHKFGFRALSDDEVQLHDCGIVYHPMTSYVLCVMTSGFDAKEEESAIAEVSQIVYNTVSDLEL